MSLKTFSLLYDFWLFADEKSRNHKKVFLKQVLEILHLLRGKNWPSIYKKGSFWIQFYTFKILYVNKNYHSGFWQIIQINDN